MNLFAKAKDLGIQTEFIDGHGHPHVLAGDTAKAQALFERVVAVANDVGLLAEEYDSEALRQSGNFPQALTHIALINTAHNLSDARHGALRLRIGLFRFPVAAKTGAHCG